MTSWHGMVAGLKAPMTDQDRRHNAALADYSRAKRDGPNHGDRWNKSRRHEQGLLSLAEGIEAFAIGFMTDQLDYLSAQYFADLMRGFHGLLDYDRGRLDGRTCDEWRTSILGRFNIDPDTYEWGGPPEVVTD